MKSTPRWTLAILALLVLGILGVWKFKPRSAPEIAEIAQTSSPMNTWTARVVMTVYGDHWFVNDARYEVRIERADGKDEVLVYSTIASGPTGLVVHWISPDELEVRDSADALRDAVREPHPTVRIAYRPS